MTVKYIKLFLSARGSISRQDFWIALIITAFFWATVIYTISKIDNQLAFEKTFIILFVAWLLVIVSIICITIKRYRDLNKPWYFGLLMLLIPIFGWMIWLVECGFKASSTNKNSHGI